MSKHPFFMCTYLIRSITVKIYRGFNNLTIGLNGIPFFSLTVKKDMFTVYGVVRILEDVGGV